MPPAALRWGQVREAYFRLEHSTFNRKDWGYGRVAAAAHYAANQNKRGWSIGLNVPEFHTSQQARDYFLALEQKNTRVNANLGHTIILSLPNELTPEDAKSLVSRFLWKVSMKGQIRVRAWEHLDKPNNPHAHVIIDDHHYQTGKQVAYLSASRSNRAKQGLEPNATEWLRVQWEEAGNELFQERGYQLYFDRRNYLEKGTPEPGQHRGFANDNELSHPPLSTDKLVDVPHGTLQPADPETPAEDALELEGDEDMAGSVRFSGSADPKNILTLLEQLDYATRKMTDRETVRDDIRKTEYELKRAQKYLAEAETRLGDATRAEYNAEVRKDRLTKDGKPVGFGVKVLGFRLRSSKRKQSDNAIERHADAVKTTEREALLVKEHREAVQRVEAHQKSLDDQLFVLDRQLNRIGSDKELDEAVEVMRQGIRDSFAELPREKLDEALEAGRITEEEYEYLMREGAYERSYDVGNSRER